MNDGGPAFPHTPVDVGAEWAIQTGMSLRDWFAGMALQGILSYEGQWTESQHRRRDVHVRDAYQYADAMLAERSKS